MLKHLLGIEGLTKDQLSLLLDNSYNLLEVSERDIKKVPSLRGKTIINLFMEPSTRTRVSFEIAGKRLSADTINFTGSSSSSKKGESLLDTARTLQAMAPDVLVVRHAASGAPLMLSKYLQETSIVNAGDGMHEHPTQALLDCLALKSHFKDRSSGIENLNVAIVGDIRHSRVARSNIWAQLVLGNNVRLVGPGTLVPRELMQAGCFSGYEKQLSYHSCLSEGLEGVDVIMCLRLQLERAAANFIPSIEEYIREYQVSSKVIDKLCPQAVVMHPGPVNRGVEVESSLIDGERSLLTNQVTMGVAVRMAVLLELGIGKSDLKEEND